MLNKGGRPKGITASEDTIAVVYLLHKLGWSNRQNRTSIARGWKINKKIEKCQNQAKPGSKVMHLYVVDDRNRYLNYRKGEMMKTGNMLDELQRFLSPHVAKLDEVTKKVDQNLRKLEANSSDLLDDFSKISQRFTEKLERFFDIKNTK